MAATYVTKAELRTNLGIGTLYTDAVVEEVCQSAQDLLNQYLWFRRRMRQHLWWPTRNYWHNTWIKYPSINIYRIL